MAGLQEYLEAGDKSVTKKSKKFKEILTLFLKYKTCHFIKRAQMVKFVKIVLLFSLDMTN